jgi:hypothetical protein
MRRILVLSLLITLMGCDTDCNDCGPIREVSYVLSNSSERQDKIVFYFNEIDVDTVNLLPNSNLLLYSISVDNIAGLLMARPFDYYKVETYTEDSLYHTFQRDSCVSEIDLLCEENYEIFSDEVFKSGSRFIEYRLDW